MKLSVNSFSPLILLWIGISFCTTKDAIVQDQSKVLYSIIYLIHGDADYMYYDENGKSIRADENALKEAQTIAEKMISGEVFIFHQRPEKKWLWVIPRKDRRMWYYRNGKLTDNQKYSPHKDRVTFSAESELFRNYDHSKKSTIQYLFYFGHQIPRQNGQSYDRSRPSVAVDAVTVAEGLRSFLLDSSEKFKLIVLSTCNNGTPTMVNMLRPIADVLLASPQDLHLSYIATKAISLIEYETNAKAREIAYAMAQDTFQRLSESVQTEISLSVYELGLINPNNEQIFTAYRSYLSNSNPKDPNENIDCAKLPFFNDFDYSTGVHTWYRTAQFGRRASTFSHSGWGCELFQNITENNSFTSYNIN